MKRVTSFFAVLLGEALLVASLSGCSPDLNDAPIPDAVFDDIVLNLSLPAYNSLRVDGGYAAIGGGVRGIIIYRQGSSTFFAYERNCSFQPNDACSTVDVDVTGLYMIDPCCSSTFNFSNGDPSSGPAWRPLRQYKTLFDGGNLTITDEVVN